MAKKQELSDSRVWELHFVAAISLINPRGGARAPIAALTLPFAAVEWLPGWIDFMHGGEAVRVPHASIKVAFCREQSA